MVKVVEMGLLVRIPSTAEKIQTPNEKQDCDKKVFHFKFPGQSRKNWLFAGHNE